jgi:NTE family protein
LKERNLVSLPDVVTMHPKPRGELAVMLTGGGARAAYQVGLLRGIARHFPHLDFRIVTGVSAGAINAIFLAAREGTLRDRVEDLATMWAELQCHHIFRPNYAALMPFRASLASMLPKSMRGRPHGFFNAAPLAALLRQVLDTPNRGQAIEGIRRNLANGSLKAVALMTLDYSTGQGVRWVQGASMDDFEGPNRRTAHTNITIEHVLASSALPFVFPAVRIGDRWYGDGGIRLAAPLSPAVHLGASRILAMSTGYQRTPDEANTPVVAGYPPSAQLLGQLVNAIFLDVIDEDVARMERLNEMLRKLPQQEREGFKPIELCVLRPSRDLGKLAGAYEKYLPRQMKLFTRALGADETDVPDFLSLLMFEPNYLRKLIEIGEEDIYSRLDELQAFFDEDAQSAATA